MANYLGIAILDATEPDREDGTDDSAERRLIELDTRSGTRAVYAPESVDAGVREFVWIAYSRAEYQTMRTFLNARQGRGIGFWLMTWSRDMTLASDHAANSTALTIEGVGYSEHVFPVGPQRRHLAIRAPGGAFNNRRVTASVDNGNGTETLQLDTLIAEALSTGTLISFLRFSRLDEDDIRIEWTGGHCARIALPIRELPLETPNE